MKMKIKKKKEDIKKQILQKVRHYRKSKGILFFDTSTYKNNENIIFDNNELEILLIRLNRFKKILVTTNCLYIIDKKSIVKILGNAIERIDYMQYENLEKTVEEKSKLRIKLDMLKINFRIGDFRIVKKDGSFIALKIKRTRFYDCLNDSIKKLKFVTNTYDIIK